MGSRTANEVAGRPASATFSRAALTFAGNTASRKRIRQRPAMRCTRGTSRPTAPRTSQTPVKAITASGYGTEAGTIRARSCRMLVKWALAVNRNITASA